METGTADFTDISVESGTHGDIVRARGLEVFDYDGDGDLDMVVANVEDKPFFFENTMRSEGVSRNGGNNWLKVKLEGTISNRNAFGTEVKITINDQSYYRWRHGASFFAQSIKPVHFGVGDAEMIDEIQITWLSGKVETFTDIPVNQTIKIVEGDNLTDTEDAIAISPPFSLVKNYPNPFTNSTQFEFDLQQNADFHFQIFNALGQIIYQKYLSNQGTGKLQLSWEGSDLPGGVYFYQARLENTKITGKIIKD